ncbi:MAG: FAD-dependent oxidoreductase, partial [Candidatus Cloacimonadaceae bacterium]|nr:FAD-dependent oxidoreductase [Candidatus Cloacimonadaceae bacterium]
MSYDLIVIGSGPAGYVAAMRAGQTGLKTLVIDEKYVGGMCLNWGCIPTKSILESAKLYRKILHASSFGIGGIEPDALFFDWPVVKKRTEQIVKKLTKGIEYLWKKNQVEFIKGRAKILSPQQVEVGSQIFETRNILIATGSKPNPINGFEPETTIELENFFAMETLPEKPLIFGSGALAVEIAQFFRMIGKEPLLLVNRHPLLSWNESYLNQQLEKLLKKEKIPMFLLDDVKLENGLLRQADKEYPFDKVVNCSLRSAVLPETNPGLEM